VQGFHGRIRLKHGHKRVKHGRVTRKKRRKSLILLKKNQHWWLGNLLKILNIQEVSGGLNK